MRVFVVGEMRSAAAACETIIIMDDTALASPPTPTTSLVFSVVPYTRRVLPVNVLLI